MNFRNLIYLTNRNFGLKQQLSQKIFQTLNRDKKTISKLHVTPIRKYPEAKTISLPENLDGLNHSEIARWSPQRTRDITTPAILCHASSSLKQDSKSFQQPQSIQQSQDPHVDSYDCTGAISLNSSMQTNVPEPYKSGSKSTHLNMPGGQWESDNKFLAEDMRSSHYVNTKRKLSTTVDKKDETSTNSNNPPPVELTKKEKLKQAFKDYGATIVVFHVTISLMSLGLSYIAVSSGLDVAAILTSIGLGNNAFTAKIAAGTGTFVAAYALHKLFAPARMSITLACAPFIVRYLRKIGVLKPPKVTST